MARKSSRANQQDVESEDSSQGASESESPQRGGGAGSKPISKVEAARTALAEGKESPEEAVAFILQRFGIEMGRQHFSAVKSQLKKREGGGTRRGRKGRRGRPAAASGRIEGYLSPPPGSPAGGEPSLLEALEVMKPLIAQYGPDQVKRIVDLLG